MAKLVLFNRDVSEGMKQKFGDRPGVEVQLLTDSFEVIGLCFLRDVRVGHVEKLKDRMLIELDKVEEPKRVGGDVISCP